MHPYLHFHPVRVLASAGEANLHTQNKFAVGIFRGVWARAATFLRIILINSNDPDFENLFLELKNFTCKILFWLYHYIFPS